MDYSIKASKAYKETEARKVLDNAFNGDCSKIPIALKVPRSTRDDVIGGAVGISIAGKQTSIAIPALDITLDAGMHADKVLERNLLISHFDGDHVEGLGRAICNAINRKSKLDIIIPSMKDHPELRSALKKFKKKDKAGLVNVREMKDGGIEKLDPGKQVEAFKVVHAPESLGYVVSVKENGTWKQKLTYTGDIDPGKMNMNVPQIIDSETVIIDGSLTGALLSFLEPFISTFTNHASTTDIMNIARNEGSKIKNLGIVHLPMIGCNSIVEDLESSFHGENEQVFYLQSCRKDMTDDPMNRMTSFKKIIP